MWQSQGQEHLPPCLPANPQERQALHVWQVWENLQELQPHTIPEDDAHSVEGQEFSESTCYWEVLSPWASTRLTFGALGEDTRDVLPRQVVGMWALGTGHTTLTIYFCSIFRAIWKVNPPTGLVSGNVARGTVVAD